MLFVTKYVTTSEELGSWHVDCSSEYFEEIPKIGLGYYPHG